MTMRMLRIGAVMAAGLVAPLQPALAQPAPGAHAWEIGPIIRGQNHTVGMSLNPTPSREGWFFDVPYPSADAGHVHYVTFDHGSLAGKRRIVMRYRIDAAPGVELRARQTSELPATLTLYFQRRGDNWSGRGRYETYRWYATSHTLELSPGMHEVSVSLRDNWTAVQTSSAASRPHAFQEAIADAGSVGFVLGSRLGFGHGVYATGPARLTVLSFEVL